MAMNLSFHGVIICDSAAVLHIAMYELWGGCYDGASTSGYFQINTIG